MNYLAGWSFGKVLDLALTTEDEESFLKRIAPENTREVNRYLHQFLFQGQPLSWEVLKQQEESIRIMLDKLLCRQIPWLNLQPSTFPPTLIFKVMEETKLLYNTSIKLGVSKAHLSKFLNKRYKAKFLEIKANFAFYKAEADADAQTSNASKSDPRKDLSIPKEIEELILEIQKLEEAPTIERRRLSISSLNIKQYAPKLTRNTYKFIIEKPNTTSHESTTLKSRHIETPTKPTSRSPLQSPITKIRQSFYYNSSSKDNGRKDESCGCMSSWDHTTL